MTLDVTDLDLARDRRDEVRLSGARGHARPDTLKVLVGVDSGVLAEIEISYGGINADKRARLAADIIAKRAARNPMLGNQTIQYDLIGVNSVWPEEGTPPVRDVRLRVAARVPDQRAANELITEVESLYVNGPAGGGGVRFATRPTIRTYTAFVPARAGDAALDLRGRMTMAQIELFYLAHSRTGDKGNSQTMSLIPYDERDYALLEQQVTTEAVARQFGKLVRGKVTRYALPKLKAFNFVLEEALQGGVNDSLNLDTHGKSRSAVLLAMTIEVPEDHPAFRLKAAQRT